MSKKQKKYVVEDFLSDANKLLDNISDVDGFLDDLPTETTEELRAQVSRCLNTRENTGGWFHNF